MCLLSHNGEIAIETTLLKSNSAYGSCTSVSVYQHLPVSVTPKSCRCIILLQAITLKIQTNVITSHFSGDFQLKRYLEAAA